MIRTPTVVATCALALTLAACSGSSKPAAATKPAPTVTVTAGAPATPSTSSSQPAVDASGAADATDAPQAGAAAIAPAVTVSVDGASARVEVLSLQRRGDLMLLTTRMTVLKLPTGTSKLFGNEVFGTVSTSEKITLLEPLHKQIYKVATTGTGRCVCTNISDVGVELNASGIVENTYAAPPADVTKMDVVYPFPVGTVHDVPVS